MKKRTDGVSEAFDTTPDCIFPGVGEIQAHPVTDVAMGIERKTGHKHDFRPGRNFEQLFGVEAGFLDELPQQ